MPDKKPRKRRKVCFVFTVYQIQSIAVGRVWCEENEVDVHIFCNEAPSPKGSTTFPNNATGWRPSVQTSESERHFHFNQLLFTIATDAGSTGRNWGVYQGGKSGTRLQVIQCNIAPPAPHPCFPSCGPLSIVFPKTKLHLMLILW